LIMDSSLSLAIANTLDARADDMTSCSMDLANSMMGVCIRDHHPRRPNQESTEKISTCSYVPGYFSSSGHGVHDVFLCPQFLQSPVFHHVGSRLLHCVKVILQS